MEAGCGSSSGTAREQLGNYLGGHLLVLTRPWPRPLFRPHPFPSKRQRPAVGTHLKCVQNPVRVGTPSPLGGNKCQTGWRMLDLWPPGHPLWGDFAANAPRYTHLNARPIFPFSIREAYRDKRWGYAGERRHLAPLLFPNQVPVKKPVRIL